MKQQFGMIFIWTIMLMVGIAFSSGGQDLPPERVCPVAENPLLLQAGTLFFSVETAGRGVGEERFGPDKFCAASFFSDDNAIKGVAEPDIKTQEEPPSRLGALWRSFVVPGWGHHYVDSGAWRRGQYHLGAEVVMMASWLGIRRQAYVIEKNMYTHAAAYSGVDIRDREREFELAVGNYHSLHEYNDFQERIRNLDRLFPDTPEYRWEWETDELRMRYQDMRSRRNNLQQQLPALVAFMVVNRVLSGISAYNRARTLSDAYSTVYIMPGPGNQGVQATYSLSF